MFEYGASNAEQALTVREEAEVEGGPRPMGRIMLREAFPADDIEAEGPGAENPQSRSATTPTRT